MPPNSAQPAPDRTQERGEIWIRVRSHARWFDTPSGCASPDRKAPLWGCAVLDLGRGPRVRILFPQAVSQVRTAIGPPELPVAQRKQAQAPSSTGGPRSGREVAGSEGAQPAVFRDRRSHCFFSDVLRPAARRRHGSGPRLAWRPGRQRRAGCFDIAPTGGHISVGPFCSTAVPLMGSARMPRCTQRSWAFTGLILVVR
jgi:hypothetical protein